METNKLSRGELSANNKRMCCRFFMDAQASMKQTIKKIKKKLFVLYYSNVYKDYLLELDIDVCYKYVVYIKAV